MGKFTGINHLAMVTADMDKTVRFWRDLLGMRLVVGMGHPGYRHYFFEITDRDMIAFLNGPMSSPSPRRTMEPRSGVLLPLTTFPLGWRPGKNWGG